MMKRVYESPRACAEMFMPNEYVAACYDYKAELYCAIPGRSMSYVNDGKNTQQGPLDGHDHGGPCTSNNSCNIAGSTGMENSTGHAISNIKIGQRVSGLGSRVSVNIGSLSGELTDGYYKASWTNYDDAGLDYNHYGIAQVSGVLSDPSRPNHS